MTCLGEKRTTDSTSYEMVVPGSLSWATHQGLETKPCSLPAIVAFLFTHYITNTNLQFDILPTRT